MSRVVSVIMCTLLLAGAARASPYWVAYEGNDFPENEGWDRSTNWGGAERWIENGTLAIDSRADPRIYDAYGMRHNGDLDPGPGETFVLQWRVTVDEVKIGVANTVVGVHSDDAWWVALWISETEVWNPMNPATNAQFTPYVAHEFELRSSDMRQFVLTIDGQPATAGSFLKGSNDPKVWWGDSIINACGLAHWDYVRYGVVPEPQSSILVITALAFAARAAARRGR